MSKKSPVKKPKDQKPEEPEPQEPVPEQPEPETSPEPATSTPQPDETPTPAITLKSLHQELESLKLIMAQLQETMARKRKPAASNGKVQILDKQTGEIYPSKNNAYQTLLKSGKLKELVDKGDFGDIPEKNTFGWYVLVREWPERFEEVHKDTEQAAGAAEQSPSAK
ncbi:hypothetical protein ACFLX3_01655 [Chloroflexota bacterium]